VDLAESRTCCLAHIIHSLSRYAVGTDFVRSLRSISERVAGCPVAGIPLRNLQAKVKLLKAVIVKETVVTR
jgi:hypothetical protein